MADVNLKAREIWSTSNNMLNSTDIYVDGEVMQR
jgi:hypothetical protein